MAATTAYLSGHKTVINRSAERGDWQASKWAMERHPETRDDYRDQGRSGGVTVVINVPRPDIKDLGQLLGDGVKRKILTDNARRLYPLE